MAVHLSERRDAQRLLAAIAAAVLVHVGLYFGIPFLTSLDTAPLPDYGPIVVTLEEPLAAVEPPPRPPAPVPRPTPAPAPAVRPAPQPVPVAAAAPKLAVDAGAARAPARAPGASAFQQSGATTGTSTGAATASIVAGPPPVTLPEGRPSASGSGEQRSGEAVLLTGRPAAGSGALDTRKLASSLAAATTGGTGTAAATGPGTSAGAAGDIEWENPDEARDRKLLRWPDPKLPDSVKKTGMVLEVRVAFSVNADGLVTSPEVVQGSGFPDVDAACLTALRQARFSSAKKGALDIRGWRTIRITLR